MELSPEEVEAVEVSRRPTTVITANESIGTTDVKDAEMFVTVWLVEDTPAVLSTRKLFEENGYSYEWKEGETPNPTRTARLHLAHAMISCPSSIQVH